ncbi:S-adenosyl-L-methionine-dependent methyltransferase [Penicillium robsamsonii]|uniref:S-adenosyl-L-methionine-dependent methyltransferase n=1 Tax=Penicillium robsamsonii TaxID=1792511 RepID=UPI0025467DF9|nr:S-adenosyl-L-methionine-dependent methyltransferase [Penicillium robsamsonii]KAJ5834674.1 S-adenosyl-L-methionine-dependent methyltransferase [Penicillium robsamsonii]
MSGSNNANAATDPYRLNRDVQASTRLNLQHYIWKESMGYILHPSISLPNSDVFIADIGTGTGIWLHDLSRQFPNAQFHGFDISGEQYPAPGFLPSNVSLRYLDILKEIPSEYVGKYDVVHARLLVQVVNQAGGDARPIIQNFLKLLKPGGYLQWEEPNDDAGNRKLLKSDPSNSTEDTEKLLAGLNAKFQTKSAWSANLAETFAEQGLQNVQKEEFATGDYVLVLDQMNYLNLFQELITKLPGGLKEELSALHTKAIIESRKGVAWKVRRFAFVGQKQ